MTVPLTALGRNCSSIDTISSRTFMLFQESEELTLGIYCLKIQIASDIPDH